MSVFISFRESRIHLMSLRVSAIAVFDSAVQASWMRAFFEEPLDVRLHPDFLLLVPPLLEERVAPRGPYLDERGDGGGDRDDESERREDLSQAHISPPTAPAISGSIMG